MNIGNEVYEPLSARSYTVVRDAYVQLLFQSIGLIPMLLKSSKLQSEEEREAVGLEAMRCIANSGKLGEVLGCLVEPPPPAVWTPAWARATGEKFEKLTDPEDRNLLMAVLVRGLQDFFQFGRRSSVTSP